MLLLRHRASTDACAAQPGAPARRREAAQEECATLRDAPAAPPKPTPAEVAARAAATVAAGAEDDAALAALSVRELRARVEAQGLDGSRCIEKDDLVRLLQGARIQNATTAL